MTYGFPGVMTGTPDVGGQAQTYASAPMPSGVYGPALGGTTNAPTWLETEWAWQQPGGLHQFTRRSFGQRARRGPAGFPTIAAAGYGDYGGVMADSFRFGVIDNALLVAMTVAGFGLDDWIAKRVGSRGYGPIMGAAIGNALSDGIGDFVARGSKAAIGVTAGALLPVVPLIWAMTQKKALTGTTKNLILGGSLAMFALTFIRR